MPSAPCTLAIWEYLHAPTGAGASSRLPGTASDWRTGLANLLHITPDAERVDLIRRLFRLCIDDARNPDSPSRTLLACVPDDLTKRALLPQQGLATFTALDQAVLFDLALSEGRHQQAQLLSEGGKALYLSVVFTLCGTVVRSLPVAEPTAWPPRDHLIDRVERLVDAGVPKVMQLSMLLWRSHPPGCDGAGSPHITLHLVEAILCSADPAERPLMARMLQDAYSRQIQRKPDPLMDLQLPRRSLAEDLLKQVEQSRG